MSELLWLLALGGLGVGVASLVRLSALSLRLERAESWIGFLLQDLGRAGEAFRALHHRLGQLELWAKQQATEQAARAQLQAPDVAQPSLPSDDAAAHARRAGADERPTPEPLAAPAADDAVQLSLPMGRAVTAAQAAPPAGDAVEPSLPLDEAVTVANPGMLLGAGRAAPSAMSAETGGARIGLEQWLGVRGAAVLGAALLALAAAYFFKYSVDHGLLSPTTRFVAGTLTGIGCVAAAELAIRRRHALLAHCVAGAGFAILYLSFWAGWARYHLIGTAVTAMLMVVVTGSCCGLAAQRSSRAIAVYGLVGGFATPLLLSTGTDRPITLFSYLLLLDLALLFLAHRGRWPWLAVLSLLGTAAYEGAWTAARMGSEQVGLGMAIVLTFALVFAAMPRPARPMAGPPGLALRPSIDGWTAMQAAAVLLPFLFAWTTGANAELSPTLLPTAAMAVTLLLGACWLARRDGTMWLETGAAGGALGVLAAVLGGRGAAAEVAWPAMIFTVGIALLLQAARELDHRHLRAGRTAALPESPALSAWVLGSTAITLLAVSLAHAQDPWPWLAGWTALAAVALRRGALADERLLMLGSAAALGLALRVLASVARGSSGADDAALQPAAVLVALGFALASLALRPAGSRQFAAHGSALLALFVLTGIAAGAGLDAPQVLLGVVALLLAVGAAVARTAAPGWLLGAAVVAPLVLCWRALEAADAGSAGAPLIHAGQALAPALLVGSVLALGNVARSRPWTFRVAALAAPAFLPTGLAVHHRLYGDDALIAVPVGLAAIALVAACTLRWRGSQDPPQRRSAAIWLWGSFWGLAVVAVPVQWSNEWLTVGWALEGALLLVLWRRYDYSGLKLLGFALLAVVTLRLVANPAVLGYHARGELRILNWLSSTYLLPAACLLAGGYALRDREVERRRRWERDLGVQPALGLALAGFAIAVLFVWMNLTIVDWYCTGPWLELELQHEPARDLTLSLGWAIFGLTLLAVGMVRSNRALRVSSLVLILATCAKVFLYDLSHLADLYRVFSLVGLALSLIAISFAYKRFVFRDDPAPAPPLTPEPEPESAHEPQVAPAPMPTPMPAPKEGP
jgi:uncharacterized membrane protein